MLIPLLAATWPLATVRGGAKGCGAASSKDQPTTRAEVLRRVPHEPGVLINIHAGLLPASGDLTRLGQRATPALRRALLESTDNHVRWRAAQVLTQLRDVSARPDLHAALADWIPAVRHQALRALAVVGNERSVVPILKRLRDDDETRANRVAALHALGRIGDGRAAPAILRQLRAARPRMVRLQPHDEPEVRLAAVNAMWDLRHAAPRSALLQVLYIGLMDGDPRVVRRAAIAAGHLGDPSALPFLRLVLLGETARLRNVAAWAIGHLGHPGGIGVLLEALPRVRTGRLLNNISFALKRLNAPDLHWRLQGFLTHQQAYVRLNAAFTAGEMRDPRTRTLLEGLLEDPNALVRAEAVVALAKLRSPAALPALQRYAEQVYGPQRELALRAALYVEDDRALRDRYLRLTARSAHRRRAGLVLSALRDPRGAALLYGQARTPGDDAVWAALARSTHPLAEDLLAGRLRDALVRGEVDGLSRLLWAVPADRRHALARPLVRLLLRRWPDLNAHPPAHRPALQAVLRTLGASGETPLRPWLDPYGQHRDYWVRLEAQTALARLGDDAALGELVRELRLAADGRRDRLAQLLGRLPRHRLAPALADLQTHADPYVRLAAGAALHYAGHPQSPALLDALASPRPALRARARAHLAQDLDRAARDHLRDLREATRHRLASAALDRVLREHPPRSAAFGQFQPTEVVLF